MALNAQILLSILAHESDAGDISQTLRATPATYALALADGTGANQSQVVWSDARTIGASGVDDLDLKSLSDDRGTVSLAVVRLLYVRNTSESGAVWVGTSSDVPYQKPSDFFVGAPISSDSLGGGHAIYPSGALVVCNAAGTGQYIVTPSTKVLRIGGADGATYEIILIGEGTIT